MATPINELTKVLNHLEKVLIMPARVEIPYASVKKAEYQGKDRHMHMNLIKIKKTPILTTSKRLETLMKTNLTIISC